MLRRIIGVILIVSAVIVPHEVGHLLAAKSAGVGVIRFSLGFGPVLASTWIGETEVCLSALPFGGYVELAQGSPALWRSKEELLELQRRNPEAWRMLYDPQRSLLRTGPAAQFLISIAGSAVNFIFVLASVPFLFSFARQGRITLATFAMPEAKGRTFIGPIAILKIAGRACDQGLPASWLLAVRFALGIGVLQLVPLPFLDGRQAFQSAIDAFRLYVEQGSLAPLFQIAVLAAALYWLFVSAGQKLRELQIIVSKPSKDWREVFKMLFDNYSKRL